MKSFFSRIQNKFKESYGGRYVETILMEASHEDKLISELLSGIREKCHIETEFKFMIDGRPRIADLVVLNSATGSVESLVEIKYDDHRNEKNPEQLDDYVKYCKKHKCKFIYLTQYYPPSSDLDIIKESHFEHLLFSQFAEKLNLHSTKPITKLFIKYLEDKGLMMKNVDTVLLYKYLVRLFNPIRGHGKIQNNSHMIEGIPSVFNTIMNNISVISQEMSRYTTGKRANRVPVIDFTLWPSLCLSKKEISEYLENSESASITIEPDQKHKNGGDLYVFAKSVVIDTQEHKDEYLYVEYGYKFNIEKGGKDFSSSLYVHIYGRRITDPDINLFQEKNLSNKKISGKVRCLKVIKDLMCEVSLNALKYTEMESYKKSLKELQSQLKKHERM